MDLVEVSGRGSSQEARHPWELARFSVVSSMIRRTIGSRSAFNVLDVGCGDVFFVAKLSEAFPEASIFGIDTAFTTEQLKELGAKVAGKNIRLFRSLAEAESYLNGSIDLVLLLDVIEHVKDDVGLLKELSAHRFVTSDTNFIITVPAFQGLFSSHDVFLGHFRRYSNKTLRKTLAAGGLKPVRIGYFFTSLLFPRLIRAVAERLRPSGADKSTGLVSWKQGAVISGLLKNALVLDHGFTSAVKRVTGLSIPGLSNYAVCKRSAS
jgi:SAM-dependent methyltransferase